VTLLAKPASAPEPLVYCLEFFLDLPNVLAHLSIHRKQFGQAVPLLL